MHSRPPNMTSPMNLPLVDISNPEHNAAGKAMLDAAVKYGFLYIDSRTTIFTKNDVESAFDLSKEFFNLPVSEKATYRRGPDNLGWVGMHVETLDPEHHERGDFKEALNIRETKNGKIMQPLPPCIMNREEVIARFSDFCNQTCIKILKLLAHGLEIPDDFFTRQHDSTKGYTENAVRLLYYPSDVPGYCPGKDIRAGAHSDYGSVTLLFQRPGQPGLEIQTPDHKWAPVSVYPNQDKYPFPPILVNIGDALSYWTDGLLKSTVHRVVFPDGGENADRYSIAFFCSPVETTELTPVPSDLVAAHREKKKEDENLIVGYGGGASELNIGGRRLTAGEHLQARLAATYL